MACVLVHIEAAGTRPSEASVRVLGEGRRIATSLGAALYAYLQGDVGGDDIDLVAAALGAAGADKVILSRGPSGDGPPIWSSHGPALVDACQDLRPLLVLLPGDATGHDLGPRLAAAIGAAFMADPVIERGSRGEVVFSRAVYGSTHRRRLSAEEVEQAVVVSLPSRGLEPAAGDDEADVEMREPELGASAIEYLGRRDDPGAELESARVLVVAGAGVTSFETYALVEALAEAMGGQVAATRDLCEKGIAPREREIGIGSRRVSPEIMVVCGASGSSASLGALACDAEIVAIDRNPEAAIFRVARYGLVGELEVVLPELIAAIRGSSHQPARQAPGS